MVRSQYELVTRHLGLDHVFLVSGLSMGGMQTFQWIVSYPAFMDRALAIVGTPKQTSYDILLWSTELELIEAMTGTPEGRLQAMRTITAIQDLHLRTPAWVAAKTPPASIAESVNTHFETIRKLDPFDYASQLRAMISHDIYADAGGSAEAAAKAVRAKTMIVVALQDLMVNPGPAREFARLAGAELLTLSGDCGHLASGCESEILLREARRFLE